MNTSLSNNKIGNEGMEYIAEIIPEMQLEELYIDNNENDYNSYVMVKEEVAKYSKDTV